VLTASQALHKTADGATVATFIATDNAINRVSSVLQYPHSSIINFIHLTPAKGQICPSDKYFLTLGRRVYVLSGFIKKKVRKKGKNQRVILRENYYH
jgi:hypothetical protein